ncbi:MAG: hypothetical protein SynsKO_17620 [Synoicihabitans sp.]
MNSSGYGILSPIIAVFCLVVAFIGSAEVTGNPDAFLEYTWIPILTSFVAGGLCWSLSRFLDKRLEARVVDQETGEIVIRRPSHAFWFIPMRWYAVIWPVFITLLVIFVFK